MVLSIRGLTRTFQGPSGVVRAVEDVTLSVDRGEFVAVVGPSGCGKTTLLLAAGTLQRPSAGEVTISGTDPYAMSAEERCRFRAERIGFVFQQFHLIPYLSVLDNVLAPALARPNPNAKAHAMELIRRFNLEHRQAHVPADLSTGERQRTALARALLHEPELILADEPTGNLDRSNADAVQGYLAELAKDGRAVLMVTHDDAAKKVVSRYVRMEGGRLV